MILKLKNYFSLIKFSHSLFALPFALSSMLVAAHGFPPLRTFFLIVVAMILARSSAMAFNRLVDSDIDAQNPRTQMREIPQKILSKKQVFAFFVVSSLFFAAVTFFINRLCFFLSPVALTIILFYSITKRFTSLSHFFLGLGLGISPVGSWLAVTGEWSWKPVVLGIAVLFWVASFDIIYATQDYEFDKKSGLHSLVVRLGLSNALHLSSLLHLLTFLLLIFFGLLTGMGWTYYGANLLIGFFLFYQHRLVKPDNLSRVNAAFFTANGVVSILFLVGTAIGIFFKD
ncbi:MAG: UbiA family prenyltransferase [Deltaproteobacteria bacterium]|nr:UbiA family prenyltransferase [Deltaproteobacteria bacterium]